MQEYYYKATLDNKTSYYDRKFTYQEGLNIHPHPDKYPRLVCGQGLHLAKTLKVARRAVPIATEFYRARAGVILAEDDEKIRCAYVWLDKQLTPNEISNTEASEMVKQKTPLAASTAPLCGQDWFNQHANDITQADIDALRLEVKTDNKEFSVGLGMKSKDRKFLIKQAVTQ